MALTTVDFTTTFNYTVSPKLFRFEDVTDYAGQGVDPDDYEGVLKVTAPTGLVIYNNTNWASPDIRPGTSVFNTTTIPLPLDANGNVLQGTYVFTYTVSANNGVDVITKNYSYTFSYTSPSISISAAVDYNAPLISGTDETSYTVNLITPTVTRAFEMTYPSVLNIASITGTNNVLSTDTFYVIADTTLQYTFTLESALEYDFGNNLFVADEISGTQRLDVFADANLCQLYCGLRATYNRWYAAKGTAQEATLLNTFKDVMAISMLLQTAYNCGRSADVAGYVAMIKAIGNFDDCTCDESDEPVLVTGIGGSSGTIVVAAGSGIAVAVAEGGSSTTYTVSIDAATLALINSIDHTVVEGADGIIVTSTTNGNTTTYTVRSTIREVQVLKQFVTITFEDGALPVITYGDVKVYGGLLQQATVAAANNSSVSAWNLNNNLFVASAFFTGAAVDYYADVYLVSTDELDSSSEPGDQNRVFDLEMVQEKATTIEFRLKGLFGNPVNGNSVNSTYSSITFLISITA